MEAAAVISNPGASGSEIVVRDPRVRVFHGSLAASFTVAYLSGEDETLSLHAWSGYLVGGLILFPCCGVWSARGARFVDFVFTPATILAYGRDLPARTGATHSRPQLAGRRHDHRAQTRLIAHIGYGYSIAREQTASDPGVMPLATRVGTFPGAIHAPYRYNPQLRW